jgi:protein ImuB
MPTGSRLYACIISPNAAADEVDLLSIAYGFAYRVERLDDGVLFDVTGLEKLVGNHKAVAREVLKELKKKNLSGNVAVAETIESALVLARQHGGLNHTAATSEKFHQTTLQNLDIDPDTLNVFRSLGIDNVDDLRQIPEADLIARYGKDFRSVLDVISQTPRRTLVPNIWEKNVVWSCDLDFAVDDFGQLIFIVNRALDELLADVSHRAKSTEQVDIHFQLEKSAECESDEKPPRFKLYEIKTSFPTLDRSFWLKLINLRISVDPPPAEIIAIRVTAHFTKERPVQTGLYAASRPTPESLLLTVGKIKKLVGEENVGIPVVLKKRLERPFTLDAERLPTGKETKDAPKIVPPVIAFSYFEPPIPAEVFIQNRKLIYLRTRWFNGRVLAYSGVWKTSSGWWGKASWKVHEWHVEVEDAGIYRLRKKDGEWFVMGEFD